MLPNKQHLQITSRLKNSGLPEFFVFGDPSHSPALLDWRIDTCQVDRKFLDTVDSLPFKPMKTPPIFVQEG